MPCTLPIGCDFTVTMFVSSRAGVRDRRPLAASLSFQRFAGGVGLDCRRCFEPSIDGSLTRSYSSTLPGFTGTTK